jgi:hypothetical protein
MGVVVALHAKSDAANFPDLLKKSFLPIATPLVVEECFPSLL